MRKQSVMLLDYFVFKLLLHFCSATIFQQIIYLNDDGSVTDTSRLPKCSNGARINLLSYSFLYDNCPPDAVCGTQLSQTSAVRLHELCSLREVCQNMNFPVQNTILGMHQKIKVKYECLDHFTEFLDICENLTKPIYNTVHLVASKAFQHMGQCFCSLEDGVFSLIVNDVRLMDTKSHHCSSAQLQLSSSNYSCIQTVDGYGSVFNRPLVEKMTSFRIVLRKTLLDSLPQMTWLIIKPEESLKITCESVSWKNKPTISITTKALNDDINATISTVSFTNGQGEDARPIQINTVIIIVFVLIGVISIIAFLMARRHRKVRKKEKKKQVDGNSEKGEFKNSDGQCSADNMEMEALVPENKTNTVKINKTETVDAGNQQLSTMSNLQPKTRAGTKPIASQKRQTSERYENHQEIVGDGVRFMSPQLG